MNPARQLVINCSYKLELPPVYHQIRQLMHNEDSQINHYVDVVTSDLTLAERVVRLANSNFLGYRRQVRSVKQAITLIGAVQVHDLLLSLLAVRTFDGLPKELLDLDAFWRGNIFCGVVARNISRQLMLPARERLFTLGLLHDIGHMVMFTQAPSQIQQAIAMAQDTGLPLHLVEQQLLGYHYGDVGSELANHWELPGIYVDTIGNHMSPVQATENRTEKAIINLAQYMLLNQSDDAYAPSTLQRCPGWQLLKISPDQLNQLRTDAQIFEQELLHTLRPTSAFSGGWIN